MGFDMYGEKMISIIAAIYVIILAFAILGGLISYVLKGIGLYTLAKRKGHHLPFLSFVPYARIYLQGEVAGEINIGKRTLKNVGLIILLAEVGFSFVLGIVMGGVWIGSVMKIIQVAQSYDAQTALLVGEEGIIGLVVSYFFILFLSVIGSSLIQGLRAVMNYQIYRHFTNSNRGIFHSTVGLFIPCYESVYLFLIRNRKTEHIEVAHE